MTPLAQEIVKELLKKQSEQTFVDGSGVLQDMGDIHCFECSDVLDLARDMVERFDGWSDFFKEIQTDYLFLPAPKTWIEFRHDTPSAKGRFGFLFNENPSSFKMSLRVSQDGQKFFGSTKSTGITDFVTLPLNGGKQAYENTVAMMVYAMLVMINQPRIIGRKTHQPHKGLAKAIKNAKGHSIAHPFKAWTEITLDVSPTQDVSDEEGFETRLTGKKALHFCRAHLRLWMGKLIFVKSHWRGSPALGLKRSRYKLAA